MNFDIQKLEKKLKIKMQKKSLLIDALTHKSSNSTINNEKLEFLGDRVIGIVLSNKLFHIYPKGIRKTNGVCDVEIRLQRSCPAGSGPARGSRKSWTGPALRTRPSPFVLKVLIAGALIRPFSSVRWGGPTSRYTIPGSSTTTRDCRSKRRSMPTRSSPGRTMVNI